MSSPLGPSLDPEASTDALANRLANALGQAYRIERRIGAGGFATVFLVRDLTLKRPLAIKVLSPDLTASAAARERFRREAEIVAQLSHPHIVPLHFIGASEDLFYLAMTYIEGETLGERLRREGRLPLEGAATILREMASALDYAHRRGVVHRDVKPQNVLLDRESGRASLTDFGIARSVDSAGLTTAGVVIGTPAYMSPEQLAGEAPDPRADVYALGVVAHEMFTGDVPFGDGTPAGIMARRFTESLPPLRRVRPEVSELLSRVVAGCVESDTNRRYRNGGEVLKAIDSPLPTRGRRSPARYAIIFALGLLVVLAAWMGWIRAHQAPGPTASPPMPPGLVQVRGGSYVVGRDDGQVYARPAHLITLPAFGIESTETTARRYLEFITATGRVSPWIAPRDSTLPATGVTWSEANAYCAWRYEGGRLPTEEEWEAAARGEAGSRYPWGDAPRAGAANTSSAGRRAPAPPRSYPSGTSALGVADLIGNVWEWTSSRMAPYPGGGAPPDAARYMVIRGGAFDTPDSIADATWRGYLPPTTANRGDFATTGFRCAMSLGATR